MSTTIIVPLDGSDFADRAIPVADMLARRTAGTIVLVALKGNGMPLDLDGFLDDHAQRFKVQAKHNVFTTGTADEAIATVAALHPGPLVVMSSHGPTAIGELVVGSVTSEVLHQVSAPILLLGPHAHPDAQAGAPVPDYASILLCVDGSKASEAAIAQAKLWGTKLAAKATVIQVLDPAKARRDTNSIEAVNEAGYIQRVAHDLHDVGIDSTFDVLHDPHADRAIVQQARELPNPIIIMATHGRTGVARIALGSTAMAVVRHAHCPVLVIRPTNLAAEA